VDVGVDCTSPITHTHTNTVSREVPSEMKRLQIVPMGKISAKKTRFRNALMLAGLTRSTSAKTNLGKRRFCSSVSHRLDNEARNALKRPALTRFATFIEQLRNALLENFQNTEKKSKIITLLSGINLTILFVSCLALTLTTVTLSKS